MSYVCSNPESFVTGVPIGNGQCVAFIQRCTNAPVTSSWNQGTKVRGDQSIARGTAIATFINGEYPSNKTGNHAAIYISQDEQGITVYDQWKKQTDGVKKRVIRWKGGVGSPSNDGDAFSIIE